MICNTRNQIDRELQYIAKMADAHFDGLLFLTNHVDDGRLRDAVNMSGKIVLIDNASFGDQPAIGELIKAFTLLNTLTSSNPIAARIAGPMQHRPAAALAT